MFDYIKGKLISKNIPHAVVENNGIGWLMLTNARILATAPDVGSEVKFYTKLIHKEDSMTLCGFLTKEDRTIFDILTGVSGIGTKVALCLLDEFSGAELISAVLNEDYKLISRTKGVGPKMAQKIILELKDKLTNLNVSAQITSDRVSAESGSVSKETAAEVQAVLQSLGYTQGEYQSVLEFCAKKIQKDDPEELLKETLLTLNKG